MTELPTGTVTLVFTDIEGSTALLSRLDDAYADAIDAMRSVLRAAWQEFGGVEMGTEGDSFFVVFGSAPPALAAVVQAQRGLAAVGWPHGESVNVRMGLHAGAPIVHGGGYIGMDVHRAARISGAAHGGQIVLSAAVKELVAHDMPAAVTLVDLGAHQLKDIAIPERLFQIAAEDLRSEFPPLRSIGASSSLPAAESTLIGRDGELAELEALMRATDVRMVTLTGPGGSGKTRLSISLAGRLAAAPTRFADGVYFVPLAEVTTAQNAWAKIGDVLELPSAARTRTQLLEHLAGQQALLVLDNLEQISDIDTLVDDISKAAPRMAIVASSRHPLHVRGEHEHPVPPLALPTFISPEAIARSAAVQMFVEYARRVRPSLELGPDNGGDIAQICQRLDGLPLALELAAARCKLLSPKALADRLGTALDIALPGSRVPIRQRTLRETIEWSYRLLSADQQRLFRQLSVFAGGADLEAIAGVTTTDTAVDPLDLISELVDASLVTITDTSDGEPRVGMLETIRSFARDKLAELDEIHKIRQSHATHFAGVAEQIASVWLTEDFAAAHLGFELDIDNLREAMAYATDPAHATAGLSLVGLRIANATRRFWTDAEEAHTWLIAAVRNPAAQESAELAMAVSGLAGTTFRTNEVELARSQAIEAAEIARQVGSDDALCLALQIWAQSEIALGKPDQARGHLDEAIAIAETRRDFVRLGHLYDVLGFASAEEEDFAEALTFHQKALDAATSIDYAYGIESFSQNVACQLRLLGRYDEAGRRLRAIIRAGVSTGDADSMITLSEDYACVLAGQARFAEAATLFGAASAARELFHRPADSQQARDIARPLAQAEDGLAAADWVAAFAEGRRTRIDLALLAHAATS